MVRYMGDAVIVTNLPAGLDLYAGYINGVNTRNNFNQLHARFTSAKLLTITVDGSLMIANICDCENGDYTPAAAATWADFLIRHGIRPTIYCNRTTYNEVVKELAYFGRLFGRDVDCWLSTLDGTMTSSLPGVVAIQFSDNGGLWDKSVVYSDAWFPTTPVDPPVDPVSPKERKERMIYIVSDGTSEWLCGGLEGQISTGWKHKLSSPSVGAAWAQQLGVSAVPTDPDFINRILNTE